MKPNKTTQTTADQTAPAFGKESVGRSYENTRFEIQYRNEEGNGEWYSLPSYRNLKESEVPAAITKFLAAMKTDEISLGGGMTAKLQSHKTRKYELRVIRRESVCTVIKAQTFISR